MGDAWLIRTSHIAVHSMRVTGSGIQFPELQYNDETWNGVTLIDLLRHTTFMPVNNQFLMIQET